MTTVPGRPAPRRRGLAAPLALPAGFAALLVVGALAAATGGRVDATWVLILAAVIVAAGSLVAEPSVAPLLGATGWLTVAGFSRARRSLCMGRPTTSRLTALTMATKRMLGRTKWPRIGQIMKSSRVSGANRSAGSSRRSARPWSNE